MNWKWGPIFQWLIVFGLWEILRWFQPEERIYGVILASMIAVTVIWLILVIFLTIKYFSKITPYTTEIFGSTFICGIANWLMIFF